MEKKNFYIAVTAEENNKYYSYMIIYHNCNNLLSTLKEHEHNNLIHANICKTKKEAREIVEFWNNCYKQNGTYMFENPSF